MRFSKFCRCPETITRPLVSWSQNLVFIYAKSLQLCLTLCSSVDHSPSGCSVQARILEWVASPSSRRFSWLQGLNSYLWCLPHWHAGSLLLVPPGKPLRKKKPSSGLYSLSKNIKCRKVSWVFCLLMLYWYKTKAIVGLCLAAQLCPTLATPQIAGLQAPLCMGFPRQEYWNGLPFCSPGDLPTQGSNAGLLHCTWIL